MEYRTTTTSTREDARREVLTMLDALVLLFKGEPRWHRVTLVKRDGEWDGKLVAVFDAPGGTK